MRALTVQGVLSPQELSELLPAVGVTVQSSVGYAFGTMNIVLFVGRKYTFRSGDYLGLLLMATFDATVQRIDVGYAGGGAGFLGAVWGAGSDLEDHLINAIVDRLTARSLTWSEVRMTTDG
ncbi:MAG TPA: hypothetical protein VML94_08365 [Thermoplasmata archaeon]|nr:hypothetical protein [Thermoplasmata archaeon]